MQGARSRPPRAVCLCGQTMPSRPHLVWQCSETTAHRSGIRPPCDRAEERLFARALPEYPIAPEGDAPADVQRQVADALLRSAETNGHLVVATDGSADGIAAFALVFPGTDATLTAGNLGEDQKAFRAELEAGWSLVERYLRQLSMKAQAGASS